MDETREKLKRQMAEVYIEMETLRSLIKNLNHSHLKDRFLEATCEYLDLKKKLRE